MDVQTGLVYVGIVVISAAAIAFILMFGTREKSYEEAIAEQRKLPDDLLSNKKDKNKEKKHKNKAGKKVKEKKEEKDDKEDKDERSDHVQFEETPQILPPEPPVQESNKGNKKKGKLEKIKPILVNKDEPSVIVTELNPSQSSLAEANHFDLIHPKDDLELVRSHSITETVEKVNKSPKDTPTKSKKNNKDAVKKKDENSKDEKQDANTYTNASSANKEAMKEIREQQKETPVKEVKEVVKEVVQQLPNREPKKTKKKNDILSQIDGDAVNVELLMLCIQKAELSRSEIQILTNQLLNKQQDNPSLEHSEWTEGRADPVIKLKKQLAEKEKALVDEHEASVAVQNKLKDLRSEFNSDRSRLLANIRQLEESLNAKITETQTLHTRMQHILESHVAEKQGFARQIEQLQAKVNEDAAIIHKLQEDQGQTQGHLQQELMAQRKQMEVQFAQMRDNENALKSQLAQKHVEMQDLQNELAATCESSTAEIDMLRQQLGIMQGQLMHSEGQLQHFKEANDRLQDVARQLEESHRAHTDLDHRLKNAHRHEQELQKQVNSLQAELNHTKNEANETSTLKVELSKAQTELMKLKSELSATMNEAESEAAEIRALTNALSTKEDELKRSQDKFYAIQNDLQQSSMQVTRMESELNSVQKKLDMLKTDFERTECSLKEAKNDANQYQNKLYTLQEKLADSQMELGTARNQIRDSNAMTSEIKALQTEINRLQNNEKKAGDEHLRIVKLEEENDRLRTELANAIEKQKELQQQHEEKKVHTDVVLATTTEPQHANLEEKALLEKLTAELTHKEEEFNKIDERLHVLESDADKHQCFIRQLEEALEAQKSKNNELRTKNWKVMEALSAAELRAKSNDERGVKEATQKIKEEQEEITKALLQRIFPEIKVSEKAHEQWLKSFEDKISTILNELKQKNTDQINPDLERQNKNLQGMVSHYKRIIYDTEGMLNRLQSYIESEEAKWQSQLRPTQTLPTPIPIPTTLVQSDRVNRRPSRPSGSNPGRKNKKSKNHSHSINATKDLGRWKPADDLALITGVQQTNDLRMVHRGTKFSCRFTLQEIQQRWYALLYDSAVSRVAVQAMRNLHPELIASVQARTLYSKVEEELLGTIKSTSQPTLEVFQELLEANSHTFYPARTAKALHSHWQLMKQYHLLPDQTVQSLPRGEHVLSFSDAEDMMNDTELMEPKDELVDAELATADRKNKREIKVLENELSRWQVLVDSVTGVNPPEFDNQTLAILRGRLVRYLMRSREISVGRSTKDHTVDVDLGLEGPAWKVSRRQGTIRLRNNGDFFLSSEGKRPIFVDSRPILAGNKMKLNNNSVIEIAGLRFIFLINQELISVIRQEAVKLNLNP